MTENQKLREALQLLLASGGVIAEATDAELMAAVDDPEAEHIVKVQAAAVLNARQALSLPTAAQVDDINVAESFTSVTKTAEPVGERAKFDAWKKTMQYGFNEWDAWQARAAVARQALALPTVTSTQRNKRCPNP